MAVYIAALVVGLILVSLVCFIVHEAWRGKAWFGDQDKQNS